MIRDHLGSVRATVTDEAVNGDDPVMEEFHYYPFGMRMEGDYFRKLRHFPAKGNAYQYNGKELYADLGFDWMPYGARYYDAAVGRFVGVDPLADRFPHVTTYNYAENRPISGVDLWGLQYLDHNLKFAMDNSGIKVSGKLDVNVKVLNLTNTPVNKEALKFHQTKSSTAFDFKNNWTFTGGVPLNPITGEAFGESVNVEGKVNIDFTFETISSKSEIETGDVVLGLVLCNLNFL